MFKKHPFFAKNPIDRFLIQFSEFSRFFTQYSKELICTSSAEFEKNKNIFVRLFMIKRGRYTRPFLHFATIAAIILGIIISPFIAGTYPVFSEESEELPETPEEVEKQSIIVGENVFSTDISQKPRNEIIIYAVQNGDTLSSISKKFGISEDSIRWQNDITGDFISVGTELDIIPVTGLAHKVSQGDTVYTIAEKYDTNPQKIVDFPFNDFANPETFSLVSGQTIIVPDGIKPSEQPTYVRPRPVYIAQAPTSVSSGGFAWPLRGGLSQYYSWYHPGIDIMSDVGVGIVAARSGTVSNVITGVWDGGYGNNIYIDSGDGIVTHYAHLGGVNVSVGQRVTAGSSVIGGVGLTGRTTGPHLHFEVIQNGALQNPLNYLP